MRVAHVITRLIIGGAQENTVATVLGLQRNPDVQVCLLSGPTRGPEGSLVPRLASHPGLLREIPNLVRPVSPWNDVRAVLTLTREFRTRRPDIVHTHSGKAGVVGRLAAKRAHVPVVIHTIHGPSFGAFQNAIANSLFLAAERLAARCTDHFVSVAEAMTRQYLSAGIGRRDQFSTIYSGFDLTQFQSAANDPALRARWRIGPDDIVAGKIARLFKLKGHDDLFAIAPDLVRRCPKLKFLLIGDGIWRERLERRARELGLADHFVFTGLVTPDEVPALVGIMDLLIHLSRREGLPRALPQALAAGKPVVAYDCDGASEVCLPGQTGFLASAGDLAALADHVIRLATDAELRRRLGDSGRALVRGHFTVEVMVERLEQLYRRLLKGKARL